MGMEVWVVWLNSHIFQGGSREPSSWIGPAVTAALISSLINVFAAYRITRKLDNDHRLEKTIDFTKAILAEIKSNLDRHSNVDLDEHLEEQKALLEPQGMPPGATVSYTPFTPKRVSTLVFDALISEIYVLPTSVVDDVVLYYASEHMISRLIEDMRDATFSTMGQSRKVAIYSDYIRLIKVTNALGDAARETIKSELAKKRYRKLQ